MGCTASLCFLRWLPLALICLLSAWCEQGRAESMSSVEPDADELALLRVRVGAALYARGEFQSALEQFEAARELQPTVETGLYRARCLSKLERWLDAYQAYESTERELARLERTAKRPSLPAEVTTEGVRRERDALSPHLGFIEVRVDDVSPYSRLLVNDRTVPREQWSRVPVPPGEVEVDLLTPYRPRVQRSLTLSPGEQVKVHLEQSPLRVTPVQALSLEPSARYDGMQLPAVSWLAAFAYDAAAIGAFGFGAYGVYGEMRQDRLVEMELGQCQRQACDEEQTRQEQRGAMQQLLSRVSLALGLVGVGSAVTLLVLDEGANGETTLRLSPSGLFLHGKM